jgi:plastocyanin
MNDRIKRVTGIAVGAVVLGVLTGPPVVAATKDVDVNDGRFFSPKTLSSPVGGSVHWNASGVDDHSVTQDGLVFDSGAPHAGLDFSKTFSAGTYPYHCRKHGDQGMVGTVKVAPRVLSAPEGLDFTVRWATAGTQTGNTFDVMYRVGSGAWTTWRTNTTAKSLVFGGAGPVAVTLGETYAFKVRSGTGTGSIQSGFSPIKTFRAS